MSLPGANSDARWRALVFPADYRNPRPAPRYNLVVVGAGPAGLVAAIASAGLGARVALVERRAMGGDCLNVGCVPSKALLSAARRGLGFDEAFAWLRAVRASIAEHDAVERYTRAGVDVFLGDARFVDAHTLAVGDDRLRTRKTVIATGARPAIPPIPGLSEAEPHTNETIFDLAAQPRRLAILGAGPVGCELAQAFARLGTAVDLVESKAAVLSDEEPEASALVAAALARERVRLRLSANVVRVERADHVRTLVLADGERIEADALLVAAGRQRNVDDLDLGRAGVRIDPHTGIVVDHRLRTTHRDVYAAGDICAAQQLTHNADAQARIVVRNALFHGRASVRSLIVPACMYTQPEVARVGLTQARAAAAGLAVDAWRIPWSGLDRARTDDATEGFVLVLTQKGRDRIVGATIAGQDAGEQVAPLLLMMNRGMGLGDVGATVLPYPTRGEYLRRLADAYNRTRLTPFVAKALAAWLKFRR